MIIPVTRRCIERMTRWYHVSVVVLDNGLNRLVLSEEEETVRMRRRFHLHACLLGVSGLLGYLAVVDVVSLTVVTLVSPTLLLGQEYIDRIGKF